MTKMIIREVDKANHFIAGYVIYFAFTLFTQWYWAFLMVAIIGALKEVWDSRHEWKSFDTKDFLYTLAGGIPSLIIDLI
jgi:hypothetical protein